MKHRLSALAKQLNGVPQKQSSVFQPAVQAHIARLATQLSYSNARLQLPAVREFSSSLCRDAQNRIQPSIRRPADFHTLLQSASSTNTLLLVLFKTITCHSCSSITPLLESVVQSRPTPSVGDRYGSIAFAELELDSPERDEGGGRGWTTMYDVGIEYGVRSVPTLIGFGGRRAERITDRLADEKKLKGKHFMQDWVDEVMKQGDPHPSEGKGLFAWLFRGGS